MKQKKMQDPINVAAIDIGSNAARILIKSVELLRAKDSDKNAEYINHRIRTKKLQFLRIPLRLGMDVFDIGRIGDLRKEHLERTIKVFRHLLHLYDVTEYRACATAAFREAKNGKKILNGIRRDIGIDIEIISGDEEAKIIRSNNVQEDNGTYLYMDVGGGSTELSLVSNGKLVSEHSFDVGTLRLLNEKVTADQWYEMEQAVKAMLEGFENVQIVGSGGNINRLYRLIAKKDKKGYLQVPMLNKMYTQLAQMTVEQRMVEYDLREDRADVIVLAAKLFLMVASVAKSETIQVPVVGLSDGIINGMVEKIYGVF